MKTDIETAKELLKEHSFTCVLCKGEQIYSSLERGVKPLLLWLDSKTDLKGFSAADKVVGKGAAFLYVLLGVSSVYANVMSESAKEVLISNGISVSAGLTVDAIRNRAGTGFCPIETSVKDISSPTEALAAIRAKLREMAK